GGGGARPRGERPPRARPPGGGPPAAAPPRAAPGLLPAPALRPRGGRAPFAGGRRRAARGPSLGARPRCPASSRRTCRVSGAPPARVALPPSRRTRMRVHGIGGLIVAGGLSLLAAVSGRAAVAGGTGDTKNVDELAAVVEGEFITRR